MKKNSFYALLIAVGAMGFVSCDNDDDNMKNTQEDISQLAQKIIGSWKQVSADNEDLLTNRRVVRHFNADGTMEYMEVIPQGTDDETAKAIWKNIRTYQWKVKDDCIILIDTMQVNDSIPMMNDSIPRDAGNKADTLRILSFSGSSFTELSTLGNVNYQERNDTLAVEPKEGEDVPPADSTQMRQPGSGQPAQAGKEKHTSVWTKVTKDYSSTIVGLWEGTSVTGFETYGDYNHRLEYKADGTYVYYNYVDGEWIAKKDDVSEYLLEGDLLMTYWTSEDGKPNFEWWEIETCDSKTMKWTAQRDEMDMKNALGDSITPTGIFTTTFTWKRIR